jgi:hypothetical protein
VAGGFAPSTIHATYYDGRYMGWFTTGLDTNGTKMGGGFILDKGEAAFLVTLRRLRLRLAPDPELRRALGGEAQLLVRQPELRLQVGGRPFATPSTYDWKSKTFISAGRENFACAQIIADFGAGLTVAQIQAIQTADRGGARGERALADTSGPINGNLAGFEINGGPMGGDNETQDSRPPSRARAASSPSSTTRTA